MNRKWMLSILLILGTILVSGCSNIYFVRVSDETVAAYNVANDAFRKATLANAKKWAPCQYATAEA